MARPSTSVGRILPRGQNTLFVNNNSDGWSSYPLTNQPTYSCPLEAAGSAAVPAYNPSWDPFCGPSLTVTVPSVATFLSGTSTAARSFCPNSSATPPYYPPAGDVRCHNQPAHRDCRWQSHSGCGSDHLLRHLALPTADAVGTPRCPHWGMPRLCRSTADADHRPSPQALPVSPSEVDQVVSSPDSTVSFVTYKRTGDRACCRITTRLRPRPSALGTLGTSSFPPVRRRRLRASSPRRLDLLHQHQRRQPRSRGEYHHPDRYADHQSQAHQRNRASAYQRSSSP